MQAIAASTKFKFTYTIFFYGKQNKELLNSKVIVFFRAVFFTPFTQGFHVVEENSKLTYTRLTILRYKICFFFSRFFFSRRWRNRFPQVEKLFRR